MTDKEIIDRAVADYKAWQERCRKEREEIEAAHRRKQTLIDEVVKQTGAERVDAARYVAYAMNEPAPKPQTTNGEKIG